MTPALRVNGLTLAIDNKTIVEDISFELQTGELGCILGSTGSGKTTILKAIAGFIPPKSGAIYIGEKLMSGEGLYVPPERRYCGIVFQDYNLFPHLTVEKNIAYGLRHMSQSNMNARVKKLLDMTRLTNKHSSYPHQLSGGERQRAALARAMAPSPRIILLDEPFASQDTNLREKLAEEVREMLNTESIAGVLVTHEQSEAFALADKIAVLHQNHIIQWDNAYNLYHNPVNRYVAEFIGQGTTVKGKIVNWTSINTGLGQIKSNHIDKSRYRIGQEILVFLRPDDVEYNENSARRAIVKVSRFRGSTVHYTLETETTMETFYCHAPSHHFYPVGSRVGFKLNVQELIVFTNTLEHP